MAVPNENALAYRYSQSKSCKYACKPIPSRTETEPFRSSLQITLSGFVFVIINFLTLLWYSPTLDEDMPPWVYASFAVGLFLYQTFDAVDGTQACVYSSIPYKADAEMGIQSQDPSKRPSGRTVRPRYAELSVDYRGVSFD